MRMRATPVSINSAAAFLLKRTPFTEAEVHAIDAFLGVDDEKGEVARLYTPLDPGAGTIYQRLLSAPDARTVYAAEQTQIAPPTDNQPFFNQHTRWSNIRWGTIRDLFSQGRMGRMALEDRPVAEVTLIVLLAQTIVVAGVLIMLPLLRFKREDLRAVGRGRMLIYFAGLGLGTILALMLAMIVGFLAVLVLAGGCYLAAWRAFASPLPKTT